MTRLVVKRSCRRVRPHTTTATNLGSTTTPSGQSACFVYGALIPPEGSIITIMLYNMSGQMKMGWYMSRHKQLFIVQLEALVLRSAVGYYVNRYLKYSGQNPSMLVR